METAAPEIAAFSAELEQEEPTERTVRIPEAAMAQLEEAEQEAEASAEVLPKAASENGQAPAAVMAQAAPEQAVAETETGAFSESGSSVLADGAVPAPAAEIQQSAQSDRTPTVSAGNSQKNAAASENGRISSSAQVSATKQPGNQDILERLEELEISEVKADLARRGVSVRL